MARDSKTSPLRDRADDGLLTLIGDVPDLVKNLIRAELDAVKKYAVQVAKHAGIGTVAVIVALFFLFWMIPALLAFFVILLDLWMPLWAASLIVVGIGLVLAVICLGYAWLLRFRKISKLESPGAAAKADAAIVKEFADEF
ncbi:phage holin family protein [Microbacterium sp. G2-8]|uniref:phage holin family protein n=1 Tax=Microbacterium sp. G2-8 TaxID=2842454 RepID=UPI001C8A7AE2|nr:phage holin family protein [Microbacterium sp. G2-8]